MPIVPQDQSYTVNQLLFACEKFPRGLLEPCVANIFLVYNNMGLDNAWSWTLVVANQFLGRKSRNKIVANESWFTVTYQISNKKN